MSNKLQTFLLEFAHTMAASPLTKFTGDTGGKEHYHVLGNLVDGGPNSQVMSALMGYALGRGIDVVEYDIANSFLVADTAVNILRPVKEAIGCVHMIEGWDDYLAAQAEAEDLGHAKTVH